MITSIDISLPVAAVFHTEDQSLEQCLLEHVWDDLSCSAPL